MLCALYKCKGREKHPWKSDNFSKVAEVSLSNFTAWMLYTFFKLYKWYQIG